MWLLISFNSLSLARFFCLAQLRTRTFSLSSFSFVHSQLLLFSLPIYYNFTFCCYCCCRYCYHSSSRSCRHQLTLWTLSRVFFLFIHLQNMLINLPFRIVVIVVAYSFNRFCFFLLSKSFISRVKLLFLDVFLFFSSIYCLHHVLLLLLLLGSSSFSSANKNTHTHDLCYICCCC